MTKKQAAKLNMYKAVLNVLIANAAIVATIPILVTLEAELVTLIQDMEAYGETQEDADDGVTDDKETKRLNVCRKSADIAGLLFSFATNTGNTLLAGQMKITYSDLIKTKDAQLGERCRFIHTTGTTNQVAALPYGVTVARLAALDAAIIAFEAKSTAPRDAEVLISAATEGLVVKEKDTDTLLDDKIDPLIEVFKEDEPDFYNQYNAARTIVDPGASTTKVEGEVTKTGTEEKLVEVIVTAAKIPDPENPDEEPVVFTTTTNAIGVYDLPIPIPGYYNITYEKPTFLTHQVPNVLIKLGETKTINVELTPV